MLQFQCPSCQAKCEAAAEFAGKSVVCPTCGRTAEVPKDAGAITANQPTPPLTLPSVTAVTTPDVADAQQAKKRAEQNAEDWAGRSIQRDGGAARSWMRTGVNILLCLGVVAIVIALMSSFVKEHLRASRTVQSANNLKNLALAMHAFHDSNKRLPFNGSDEQSPNHPHAKYSKQAVAISFTSGSWGYQIISYIDAGPIFGDGKGIDGSGYPVFMCPGRDRPAGENPGEVWTDFFYNNYLNDPLDATNPAALDQRRTLVGITDGTHNTIFAGHGNINTAQYASSAKVVGSTNIFLGGTFGTTRSGDNGKTSPTGVTLKRDSAENPAIGSWGGPFPNGALMAMCDATVKMFPYSTQNFSDFLTPTGGEAVILPD